jgi:hypothetical protein
MSILAERLLPGANRLFSSGFSRPGFWMSAFIESGRSGHQIFVEMIGR